MQLYALRFFLEISAVNAACEEWLDTLSEGNGMTMMNSPMTGMMMLGCGLFALLALALLVLGIAALLKYLRVMPRPGHGRTARLETSAEERADAGTAP